MIEIWKVNKSHMYFFCFQSQETNRTRTLPLYVCTLPCHSLISLCQEAQSSLQKAEFGYNAKSSFRQSSRRFHGCQFWVTSSHNSISTSVLFTNKDKIWSSDWDHNQYTIFWWFNKYINKLGMPYLNKLIN